MRAPVQRQIESLHAEGACPRLHINLLAEGTVCPDFVVEKWGEELVIDLDPSYPLDLTYTSEGVEADLSFGGYVSRCVFPWTAIYVVANRETGRGIVLEQNMPEAVRAKRRPKIEVRTDTTAAGKPQRTSSGSRRKRRPKAEPEPAPQLQPEPARQLQPEPAPSTAPALRSLDGDATHPPEDPDTREPPPASDSDELAKRRRSAFRVIDGGD